MREENLRFMQYCAMNRKEEQERERELERLVNEEVEKKWAHTMKQYKLERDARQKLLGNVMKTRHEQIEERSKLNLNFIPLYYNAGVNKTGSDRIKLFLLIFCNLQNVLVIAFQGLIRSRLIQVNCHSILSNLSGAKQERFNTKCLVCNQLARRPCSLAAHYLFVW